MSPARPRILLVGPWSQTGGGVATFMQNVARSRLAEKYDFIPFTTLRPAKRGVRGDNYGYAAMFSGGAGRILLGMLVTLWHLVTYPWVVVRRQPAAIQIQASDFQAFWEAALYVLMGNALRRPILLRIGGSFDRFWASSGAFARSAIRWVLCRPSLLILQSEYWYRYVTGLGRTAPVVVLNNFVPEVLVEGSATRSNALPRFLLCCGEAPRLKGAYTMLDAVGRLVARGIRAEIVLLAVPAALREEIRRSGLDRHVRMLDFLPHGAALAELRRADVFLQISGSEGFPNMLLEAMALGCAAIATPVGAVPEVVGPDGECAFIVPVGDSVALVDRMARLAADRCLLARMAAAARARVKERYTEGKVAPVLDLAYGLAMHGGADVQRADETGAYPINR